MANFNYAGEFGEKYHQARSLPERAQGWISQLRAEKIQGSISNDDRVLEYGVGFGWNLASIRCREKIGFDVANLRSEVEQKGIRFVSQEESLPRKHFDIVLAHHVLEHVANPFVCLSRWKSLLAPGGKLLLFVPFEREREYVTFRTTDRAHHLYSWTLGSIERLLVKNGWHVLDRGLNRFRFDRAAALGAVRLGGGARLFRLLHAVGLKLLPEFEIYLRAAAER